MSAKVSGSNAIIAIAMLCAASGCAKTTVVRAGNECGVIYSNGVTAWVPCAKQEASK